MYNDAIKFIYSRVDLDLASFTSIFGPTNAKNSLEKIGKDVIKFEINALNNLKKSINKSFSKIVKMF